MPAFNQELYNKQQKSDHRTASFVAMQDSYASVAQGANLFQEIAQQKLENLKEEDPDGYAILENQKAFQELTPDQQRQVKFNYSNPGVSVDVKNAKIIEMKMDEHLETEDIVQEKTPEDLGQIALDL